MVYLTNAVKHFRGKAAGSGKRRFHDQPAARHVTACLLRLEAELGVVRPHVVVALGPWQQGRGWVVRSG